MKFIVLAIDIREMQRRIAHALRSLSVQCAPSSGPLVSVVVPTRNEADRLPKLLYSIKNQCYRDIEVVVADYMSTDSTPQIAKLFGARVLNIEKPGVGYATYLAVNECKGEIIIRTDADTIFPRDILSLVVTMLQKKDKLVAHVGHVYYDGGFIENAMAFYYDKYLRKPWNTTGHFIAFKRELVEKGINFNPKLRYDDDWDFGYRVYQAFGPYVFSYNYYKSILVSARRIRTTGLFKYILGFRGR
ncbi:MAG: glycosyltransferase [Candidatus Nezhaarchaeales archaeon]